MADLAPAVLDLAVGIERLAPGAVPALVGAEVDVAALLHAPEQALDSGAMPRLRGADEVVVRDEEAGVELEVVPDDLVGELDLADAPLRGAALHLLPVLVRPRQEPDVFAEKAVVPRDRVRDDGRIHVADVRAVVHVVDRRRDVEGPRHRGFAPRRAPARARPAAGARFPPPFA